MVAQVIPPINCLEASLTNFLAIVYSFRNQYWLWCPVIGPIVGALGESFYKVWTTSVLISTNVIVGTFVYDSLFFVGSESLPGLGFEVSKSIAFQVGSQSKMLIQVPQKRLDGAEITG